MPVFLAFYAAAAVGAAALIAMWRRTSDRSGPTSVLSSDPYGLAYLRGGRIEALRTALFGFLIEGAVGRDGAVLEPKTRPEGLEPFEKGVWSELGGPRTFEELARAGVGVRAGNELRLGLEDLGFLRTLEELRTDRKITVGATSALVLAAIVEIVLSPGGGPTALLVIVAGFVAFVGFRSRATPITTLGARALEATQGLFEGARVRLEHSPQSVRPDELVMVAAAFGVGALDGDIPFLEALGVNVDLGSADEEPEPRDWVDDL